MEKNTRQEVNPKPAYFFIIGRDLNPRCFFTLVRVTRYSSFLFFFFSLLTAGTSPSQVAKQAMLTGSPGYQTHEPGLTFHHHDRTSQESKLDFYCDSLHQAPLWRLHPTATRYSSLFRKMIKSLIRQ